MQVAGLVDPKAAEALEVGTAYGREALVPVQLAEVDAYVEVEPQHEGGDVRRDDVEVEEVAAPGWKGFCLGLFVTLS